MESMCAQKRVAVEEEISQGERMATASVINKFKTEYDGDLRKERPSLTNKFHYGYVLCLSANRGLVRRGIDLLEELQVLLRREIETRERGASFSYFGSSDCTTARPTSDLSAGDVVARNVKGTGEDEPDYVFLEKNACEIPDQDGESHPIEAKPSQSVEPDQDEEESKSEDGHTKDGRSSYSSYITENNKEESGMLTKALPGLPLFEGSEANLMEQCLYYRAVGYYRLGEYRHAISACDELLAVDASHSRAQVLRSLCTYSMVSRGAVGLLFFVTVGVAVPLAYLFNKGSFGENASSSARFFF